MKTNTPRWPALLALVLVTCGLMRAAEKSAVDFRPLDLTAASAAAAKEGKLVLIDFYTTWCGPCKMLDALTWTNADVGRVVNERTVALRLDAEKEGREAATRYKIAAYPTMLLLKPDGTVVDRLVGFMEPPKFLSEFKEALVGNSSLARAMAAVAATKGPEITDEAVKARYDLARAQAREGNAQAALEGFLWCYDEGMVAVKSYSGVRLSFLLSEIDHLSKAEPAARVALAERAEFAEKRLLADASDRAAAADFAALTATLKQPERMVAVFEMLPPGDPRRASLGFRLFSHFLEVQRYADALEVASAEKLQQQYDSYRKMSERTDKSEAIKEVNHRLVITTGLNAIEVLAGAGHLDEAREMQAKLLAFDSSNETTDALQKRLERAKHPELLAR